MGPGFLSWEIGHRVFGGFCIEGFLAFVIFEAVSV